MLSNELIKKLNDDPAFQEFMQHALDLMDGLDTVDGLEKMSNEEAGEEAKVRGKTKTALYLIFSPFLNPAEKREPTEAEKNKAKERYAL